MTPLSLSLCSCYWLAAACLVVFGGIDPAGGQTHERAPLEAAAGGMSRFATVRYPAGIARPGVKPARRADAQVTEQPAAYWSRFRGPLGTGHAPPQDVPLHWGPSDNLLWRTALPGAGASSPVVWGNHIFLTAASQAGHRLHVLCLDLASGTILWQRQAAEGDPGPTHALNQHASATPVTDGKRVYAFFGKQGVYCYDYEGNLAWKRRLGDFLSIWGTASSPILYGDQLILCCDQDSALALEPPQDLPSQASLRALDKLSGEPLWSTARAASRGWSTPVVVRLQEGQDELVLNGPDGVKGYDPVTGAERWHCRRLEKFGEPCVVAGHGMLFAIAGRPGPLYGIRQGGRGDVTTTHLAWSSRRGNRDVASPLLFGDYLYTVHSNGVATCYEARTGAVVWRARLPGEYYASPVAVGDTMHFLNRAGETTVLQPDSKINPIARNALLAPEASEDFLASPAVAAGRFLFRSDRALYCVGQAAAP